MSQFICVWTWSKDKTRTEHRHALDADDEKQAKVRFAEQTPSIVRDLPRQGVVVLERLEREKPPKKKKP